MLPRLVKKFSHASINSFDLPEISQKFKILFRTHVTEEYLVKVGSHLLASPNKLLTCALPIVKAAADVKPAITGADIN